MNDFTKEELIIILRLLQGAYSVSLSDTELKSDKIQSMIDLYDAKVIESWHCEKCGHVQ